MIGNTPLVPLTKMFSDTNARVFAKLEFMNPTGSIKDRIVTHIVDHAEKMGLLTAGGTIIENTSGNTGAAIAHIAARRGYRAILTMPDKVSKEKQDALTAMGAEIVVCPTSAAPDTPEHYVHKAKSLAAEIQGSFRLDQYDNPLNADAHFNTTGPEIWNQTNGSVDYFVAAGSTGGTVTGIGKYLKSQRQDIRVVLPDPIGSIYYALIKTGTFRTEDIGSYEVEGVGEDHIAKCMDLTIIDETMQFTDKDAFLCARELAKTEGILSGGTGGANVWACLKIAEKLDRPATIVTVIPDTGLKYLSKFFDDRWMQDRQYI